MLLSRAKLNSSAALCLAILVMSRPATPYSVLSHEALVDVLWDTNLKPVLLARFPNATPEQLKQAHGYAYGGAIIQDMGFYPHGNGYFSDLTHYVRAGDFIQALLADARTLDEFAFALGALSHYAGDAVGHRYGTNRAEPLLYPELEKRYGAVLTYEDNPSKHLKTEFSFDVLEVAKGNYAPQAYRDFIGFYVATPLLERAFLETYGFAMGDMFDDLTQAINSYRYAVSRTIPLATRVAWVQHEDEITKARPGITRRRFLFLMSRSSYERDWGKEYDRPNLIERILAFLLKLLPPIGPLNTLRFKVLTPPAQKEFIDSFDRAVRTYRDQVHAAGSSTLRLDNTNFDTGALAPPATYRLQDVACAYWLDKLAEERFVHADRAVSGHLLSYYSNLNLPYATKRHRKDWQRLLVELGQLQRVSSAKSESATADIRGQLH